MNDAPSNNVRDAVCQPILSERTLRYKRNMFLSATFAIIHVFGKIDGNTFTLSGAKFYLPHADSIIGITILLTLLYFVTVFYRYANSDLLVWKTRFTEKDLQNLNMSPDADVAYFNNFEREHGENIHREFRAKLRFHSLFEFIGPLLISMTAWLALCINMANNIRILSLP